MKSLPAHWFQVLLALADGPRHGLGITDDVFERTDGQMQVWPGMLYGALRKMTTSGYVAETDAPADFASGGGKPRFFKLTPLGRRVCAAEAERLARFVDVARDRRVLRKARS